MELHRAALLVLAAVSIPVLHHASRRGYLFTGWFRYPIVPVAGLAQAGSQATADRCATFARMNHGPALAGRNTLRTAAWTGG